MGEKMAEVRRMVVEDTYNTSKIKVKDKTSKPKKETKKEEKKVNKKNTTNDEKPNLFVFFRTRASFLIHPCRFQEPLPAFYRLLHRH